MVNANVPFLEARDDDWNRRVLYLWNTLVGKHWMVMMHYLDMRKLELLEPTSRHLRLPLQKIELMLAYVADKWVIPPGMTVVQSSFGKSDHVPEFLANFTTPPMFIPTPVPGQGLGGPAR